MFSTSNLKQFVLVYHSSSSSTSWWSSGPSADTGSSITIDMLPIAPPSSVGVAAGVSSFDWYKTSRSLFRWWWWWWGWGNVFWRGELSEMDSGLDCRHGCLTLKKSITLWDITFNYTFFALSINSKDKLQTKDLSRKWTFLSVKLKKYIRSTIRTHYWKWAFYDIF